MVLPCSVGAANSGRQERGKEWPEAVLRQSRQIAGVLGAKARRQDQAGPGIGSTIRNLRQFAFESAGRTFCGNRGVGIRLYLASG